MLVNVLICHPLFLKRRKSVICLRSILFESPYRFCLHQLMLIFLSSLLWHVLLTFNASFFVCNVFPIVNEGHCWLKWVSLSSIHKFKSPLVSTCLEHLGLVCLVWINVFLGARSIPARLFHAVYHFIRRLILILDSASHMTASVHKSFILLNF